MINGHSNRSEPEFQNEYYIYWWADGEWQNVYTYMYSNHVNIKLLEAI